MHDLCPAQVNALHAGRKLVAGACAPRLDLLRVLLEQFGFEPFPAGGLLLPDRFGAGHQISKLDLRHPDLEPLRQGLGVADKVVRLAFQVVRGVRISGPPRFFHPLGRLGQGGFDLLPDPLLVGPAFRVLRHDPGLSAVDAPDLHGRQVGNRLPHVVLVAARGNAVDGRVEHGQGSVLRLDELPDGRRVASQHGAGEGQAAARPLALALVRPEMGEFAILHACPPGRRAPCPLSAPRPWPL